MILGVINDVGDEVDELLNVEGPLLLLDGVTVEVDTALTVVLALAPNEIVDGGVEDGDEDGVGDDCEEDKLLNVGEGLTKDVGTALFVALALPPSKELVGDGVKEIGSIDCEGV